MEPVKIMSWNVMSNVLFSDATVDQKDGYKNLHGLNFKKSLQILMKKEAEKLAKQSAKPKSKKLNNTGTAASAANASAAASAAANSSATASTAANASATASAAANATPIQLTLEMKAKRLAGIYDFLNKIKPDILLLQEVNLDPKHIDVLWSYSGNNMDVNPSLYGTGFKSGQEDAHGTLIQFNNAKFDIIHLSHGRLPTSGSGCSLAVLLHKITKQRYFIVNIHVKLVNFKDPNADINFVAEEFTQEILPQLNKFDMKKDDIFIMGGDFNAGYNFNDKMPEIRIFSSFVEKITSIMERYNVKYISNTRYPTNLSHDDAIIIDHIFCNYPLIPIPEDELLSQTDILYTLPDSVIRNKFKDKDTEFIEKAHHLSFENEKIISTSKIYSDHRPIMVMISPETHTGGAIRKHTRKNRKMKRTIIKTI